MSLKPAFRKDAGFLYWAGRNGTIPTSYGWHGMRFNIGRFDPKNQEYVESPDIAERKDRCCTQESCGCGCYVAAVDVDQLDQQ